MKNKGYFLPVSIIIAAVLISGSVIWSTGMGGSSNSDEINNDVSNTEGPAEVASPVSRDDHIRGSLDAPLTIIEYTDFECPYCDDFHLTLKQLMEEYEGKITWVERQFPIEGLHSKAPKEAEASECAAKLGGNDAFWAFSDKVFEITPSNNNLDLTKLPQIAEDIGLDRSAFEECLESGETAGKVEEDLAEAEALGEWNFRNIGQGIGTPYSIIITESGDSYGIPGALSYEDMKNIVDSLLEGN